ncbi:hypothetical protein MMC25_007374 [Agyrium rufum]|nr:hypothetical protein [Agyrium rufum]
MANDKYPFTCSRLNSSTFLIVEKDGYEEHPFIYAKLINDPPILVLTDTGGGTGIVKGAVSASSTPMEVASGSAEDRSLRSFLESCPVSENNGHPLNPRSFDGSPKRDYMIICTHCHYDHILGIPSFEEVEPWIVASAAGKDFVEKDLPAHSLCKYMDVPTPAYKVTHWAKDFENITVGDSTLGIQVIQTPGHTPDELAWWDEDERYLYVGDSFYERVAFGGEYEQAIIFPGDGSLIDYLVSLDKLQAFVEHKSEEKDKRRIRIGCGHVTSSADGSDILTSVKSFFGDVLDGSVPIKHTDMKRGENGSLAVPGGREIAPVINTLLNLPFMVKVATKDFHPPGHISFDTSHASSDIKPFTSQITMTNPSDPSQKMETTVWPEHCIQGTPGAEIIREIDTSKLDFVVEKGKDSRVEMYSGFSDSFGNKSKEAVSLDLAAALKERDISHVFVVGLTGDCCVKCTAIDAQKEGFRTFVVREGCKSVDEGEGWGMALHDFAKAGVKVISMGAEEIDSVRRLR